MHGGKVGEIRRAKGKPERAQARPVHQGISRRERKQIEALLRGAEVAAGDEERHRSNGRTPFMILSLAMASLFDNDTHVIWLTRSDVPEAERVTDQRGRRAPSMSSNVYVNDSGFRAPEDRELAWFQDAWRNFAQRYAVISPPLAVEPLCGAEGRPSA